MGEPAGTKCEWGRDGRNALAGEQEPDQTPFREFRFFPLKVVEAQTVAEKWHCTGLKV